VTPGKILVIRGGAIGDFILTLPVLSALRQQFPQSALELLGYPNIAGLAMAGGLVDEVRSIEARALAGFFARNGVLEPALQDYFAGFALVVSFLYDPDGIFAENFARSSKAQFIAGPHRPDESAEIHATESLLAPTQRLAIFEADPVPRLRIQQPAQDEMVREKLAWVGQNTPLVLHPGSGSERKNWPEAKWQELIGRILETTDAHLLIVGGEAEGDRLERLAEDRPPGRVQILQSRPLPELALIMQACRGFLGHDSGIAHLAAALGLRGVVLWGPSNEKVWRPRSDGMLVLKYQGGLPELPVAEVLNHVHSDLPPRTAG
jgi:heptosyltransferase-2